MTDLLYLVGWNLLVAGLLGFAVWLLCRTAMLRQRPALCHALWLLVLLKLVTPPLVPVPVLPAIAAKEHGETTTLSRSAAIPGDTVDRFEQRGDRSNAIQTKKAEGTLEPSETLAADTSHSHSQPNSAR